MKAVMAIETRLAAKHLSRVERRDPMNSYHKMSYDELKSTIPGIDWDTYYSILGIDGIKELNLAHPEAIKEVAAIIKETARRRKMPAEAAGWLVGLGARMFGGFRMDEASALDSVTRARLPILLVHGEDDEIVPFEMVHAIREACVSPVRVLTVPKAAHGISWYVDMPTYQSALIRFMEENIE